MSLDHELKPYINGLKNRKAPVGAIEMNALISTVSRIANRYINEAQSGSDGGGGADADLSKDHIDTCVQQVDNSIKKLSDSADAIIDHTEKLLKMDNVDPKQKEIFFKILESCDFHDIVGQRLTEVRRILKDPKGSEERQAQNLSGPALNESFGQDSIDEMFSQ